MKIFILLFILASATLNAGYTKEVKMTSVSFPIPQDEHLIVMQRNCQWCHSYGYILNQGKQSREYWHKVVVKMREVYKAPINPRDEKLATDYLYKHFGKEK